MSGNEKAEEGMMLVLCTFPDMASARDICKKFVADGLAACVNLIPQIESIYAWEGEMRSDTEVLAIFKLRSERFAALRDLILERHPYEVPEIVGVAADAVSDKYLAWVLS